MKLNSHISSNDTLPSGIRERELGGLLPLTRSQYLYKEWSQMFLLYIILYYIYIYFLNWFSIVMCILKTVLFCSTYGMILSQWNTYFLTFQRAWHNKYVTNTEMIFWKMSTSSQSSESVVTKNVMKQWKNAWSRTLKPK